MEITIVGDGRLFDETLQPLEKFSNVTISRGFLSHKEISSLHKQFGILSLLLEWIPKEFQEMKQCPQGLYR